MALQVSVQLDTKTNTLNTGSVPREHCSVDAHVLAELRIGQQVVIKRDENRLALYTIAEQNDAGLSGIVRLGPAGIERVGGGEKRGCVGSIFRSGFGDFTATIEPAFLSDLPEGIARGQTALIEHLVGSGKGIAVLAPHGGDIEEGTDTQARRVTEALTAADVSVQAWVCQGWKKGGGGARSCWHITSAEIEPASFPKLHAMFATKFNHAVSFHGWDSNHIGIGGGADEEFRSLFLKPIQDANPGCSVELAKKSDNAGTSPKNIVNAITYRGNGVQIEQPLVARRGEAAARVADAVAGVYMTMI